jgi:hypothetical protein
MLNSSLVYYSTSLWLNFQYKQTSPPEKGERPGLSVFMKEGDAVFHTYSSYGRGLDDLLVTYRLLDLTPLGTTISTTTRSSVFINCCWEGQLDGFEGFSPGHPWSYILRSKNYLDLHCSEDLPNLWKLRQFQISEVLLWSLPNKSLLGLSIG